MENSTFNLKQILFAWILIFTISFFAFIYILLSSLFEKYVDQSSFKDLRHAKLIVEKIVNESETSLKSDVARHLNSRSFVESLENQEIDTINKYVQNWKAVSGISKVSIYNEKGLKISLSDLSQISDNARITKNTELKLKKGYGVSRFFTNNKQLYIEVIRQINSPEGNVLGFIEEAKEVDLKELKKSLPMGAGLVLIGSKEAVSLSNRINDRFVKKLRGISTEAFEVTVDNVNFDGLLYRIDKQNRFLIVKEKLKNVFYDIFYKKYLVYFILYILIISLFFYLSGNNMIIKPLENLSKFIKTNNKTSKETIVTEIKNIQDLVYRRVGDYNKVISETHSVREKEVNMMVATLAHELNNALSYVGGNLSYLKEESLVEKPDKEEIMDSLGDIEKGFDRMRNIVSDLKVFSSKSDFQMSSIGLMETFQVLKKEFPSVEINNEAPDEKVFVDPERLIQVLDNVVQNAFHAYKDDVTSAIVKVTAYKISEDDHIYIDVLDQGDGVSIENKKKIFQPFFTTKKNKGGTGLGLALSKNIMRGMGGDLFLKDTSTKGSIFCIKVKQS